MNSRKIALSTGWLPPVPNPMNAQNVAIAIKFGLPAPIYPATEEIRSVVLKATRLPMKSDVVGQSVLPHTKPTYLATVRKAIRLT